MRLEGPPRWVAVVLSIAPGVAELAGGADSSSTVSVVEGGYRIDTAKVRPVARAISIAWGADGPLHGSPATVEVGGVLLSSSDLDELSRGRLPMSLIDLEP